MSKQRFDISLQVRGSYKSQFGKDYLELKQYYGVDNARLVKRVFSTAKDILAYLKLKESELAQREQELARDKLKLKTGGI